MLKLKGKVAFVTGAGQNIGRAISLAIAAEGGDLVLVTRRNQQNIENVAQEAVALGVRALPLLADVSDADAVREAVRRAEAEFGKIDILINNAVDRGRNANIPFLEVANDEWQQSIDINLMGPINCCQAIAPGMIARRWGRIVHFSGINALWGFPRRIITATVKSAIIGFTKSLAHEYSEYNITVNAIAPGAIKVTRPWSDEEADRYAHLAKSGVKREGTPDEIASLVAYLCTEEAAYLTGQVISVNGGSYV